MSVPVLRTDRIPLRRPSVVFRLKAEMVVQTSQRVLVRTRAEALPFDDLDFAIRGGVGAALFRDETFDYRRPTVLLVAGTVPGDYWLVATQRRTGSVAGETRFSVTSESADAMRSDVVPQSRWMPTWPATLI